MKRTTSSKNTVPRARRTLSRRTLYVSPAPVVIERDSDELLHRQVYRELVQLILSGRLRHSVRLPSSRVLAEELGVARNTVLLALAELISEGYVETRRGYGTYVSAELPDRSPLRLGPPEETRGRRPQVARQAQSLLASANRPVTTSGLLRPGEPDCTDFPFKLWARLLWETHQYPMGTTMSVARRLELLDHARHGNAWIFEDDYESEWRYAGQPPAAIQSLDRDGRVLYAGTFSTMLFPSIRLGYAIVPLHLVGPFIALQQALDDQPTMLVQPALAAFIAEGHLATHLRRQRRRYKIKQEMLLAAAQRHLAGLLDVSPDPGGQHLVGYLHDNLLARMDDRAASRRAAAVGIAVPALSAHWIGPARRQGLLLGYTALPERQIDTVVRRLARALS
jgi:DNA-binding transcriptional MocR family regulator